MKSRNKIIYLILFIITIIICVLNLKVYNSYVEQLQTLSDINNQTWEFNDFENMELDFPNFSVTSMHLKSVKARYLLKNQRIEEALTLLNQIDFDPLKMSEAQKAEAYFMKNDLAEMFNSARLAFESLPNNQNHLIWYLKALSLFKMNSEILDIYNYKNQYTNARWLYFYFTAAYGIMDDSNRQIIIKQAKEIYNKKLNDSELDTILIYIIYGEQNYKQSIVYSEEASEMFSKNNFIDAAKNYKKAIEIFPINPDHYYNNMASLFKSNNFSDVLETYLILPDSINPKNGRFEFLVARSYLNMNDTLNSCIYFNKSIQLGMDASLPYLKNLCNN